MITYRSPSKEALDLLKYSLDILDIEHKKVSSWIDYSVYNPLNPNSYYSVIKIEKWNKGKGNKGDNNKWYWNADADNPTLIEEVTATVKRISELFYTNELQRKIRNPIVQLRLATCFQMIFDLSRNTVQYDHIAPLIHRIEARSNDFDKVLKIENTQEVQEIFSESNVNVVSLKNVNKDIKMLLPMLIAKISYDVHRNQFNHDRIFNLIVDEAHNILSEKSTVESEKWKDYRLDVFEEIVKEGRKFGYYLTIASQRPSDISATIVSQIHNYFIHRLVNDNDLKLLDKTMTSLDYVSKSSIPNLSAGQAIITGISFDLPVIVKIDRLPKEEAPNSSNSELLDMWRSEGKE